MKMYEKSQIFLQTSKEKLFYCKTSEKRIGQISPSKQWIRPFFPLLGFSYVFKSKQYFKICKFFKESKLERKKK